MRDITTIVFVADVKGKKRSLTEIKLARLTL